MKEFCFNPSPSFVMHVDLNSCFASVEQQANPFLRYRPVAVAAYDSPRGCILAASKEAKLLGIRTGMSVLHGKKKYPKLIVLTPDPWKYRDIHLRLRNLMGEYTNDFEPRSIDEFVLNLKGYPCLRQNSILQTALEIKRRIKKEVGDFLTVSVGISTNRYLAKVAAGLHKPDGLDEINCKNYLKVYGRLNLTDLPGIKLANALRLSSVGIYNVSDFLAAPLWRLKAAFHSIAGLYWYQRLRGYEIDDILFARRSYGNSTAIGKRVNNIKDAAPIVARLTEKMSARLRLAGYKAKGVHLGILYKDGSFWHKGRMTEKYLYDARDFLHQFMILLKEADPQKFILNLAVSAFSIIPNKFSQLEFFQDVNRNERFVEAVDKVNLKWGESSLMLARSLKRMADIADRIAFGGVKELEEFTVQS